MPIRNMEYRKHDEGESRQTIATNNQATVPDRRPMGAFRRWVDAPLLLILVLLMLGCNRNSTNGEQVNTMNSDLNGLKKLIQLPGDVKRCEWQTGSLASHGGDWWLAAVLEVEIQDIPGFLQGTGAKEVFETAPGLNLTSSFAELKSLAGARPTQQNQLRFTTETFGVEPYMKSPLLNGKAIRLSTNQIFVVLWTN
jgi:hypothetical protein